MSFILSARAYLATLPNPSDEHSILDYLLKNALGEARARSWTVIDAAVAPTITKEQFQQGLLSTSRSASFFIGSCAKGYFIMVTQADVNAAGEYLASRVRQIVHHHDSLRNHSAPNGFVPPPPI